MLVLTMGFWSSVCKPLLELGVTDFNEAKGLISDNEMKIAIRNFGNKIPDENEFRDYLDMCLRRLWGCE